MLNLTGVEPPVEYQVDCGLPAVGQAVGSSARGGLASFLSFVRRLSVGAGQRFRPGGGRGDGHGGRAAALAALQSGHPPAAGVPAAARPGAAAGGRGDHRHALGGAARAASGAAGRTRPRPDRDQRHWAHLRADGPGHLKKKGERGYQATAAFAGDTSGGDAEVLAVFLDPGNAHATWRFADLLAALERVLGPLERGLVLRFDCQYATADDLALLLQRGLRVVGRGYADRTAEGGARADGLGVTWLERSPITWVADLGVGPIAPSHPELTCRRLLVRSTVARHREGDTAILTNRSEAELPTCDLEPFSEARQTIEGWLSEATAALQLKGLWSRACAGLEACLLHAALASNLLNWWARRVLLPDSRLPHLGLRQLIARVIALPARILQAADGRLTRLVPPTPPYARHLAPPGPTWQLPLPFFDLVPCDAHF